MEQGPFKATRATPSGTHWVLVNTQTGKIASYPTSERAAKLEQDNMNAQYARLKKEHDDGCARVMEDVMVYFGDDVDNTLMWFTTPNPMLGGVSPEDMIRTGKLAKLEEFVKQQAMPIDGGLN